jgi:dCTP deaminase
MPLTTEQTKPLTTEQINQLISSSSLGAISYQACCLINELERINDEEYPIQARIIRDVFLCVVEHIKDELWKLYDPDEPLVPKGGEYSQFRIPKLARYLHKIYSYIRYLSASSPRQTPPAIQSALTHLTELYFPTKKDEEYVCVIRPQWKYNLGYVPLDLKLLKFSALILDPDIELNRDNEGSILPILWEIWRNKQIKINPQREEEILKFPPKQIAVLSFAGLDTPDALVFPILAHELGHFIDYSERPLGIHRRAEIEAKSEISKDEVKKILKKFNREIDFGKELNYLTEQKNICLRELLADLLAVRTMGFAFFAAHSEVLKAVQPWSKSAILPTGYPDNRFRLKVILDVLREDSENGLLKFLNHHSNSSDERTQQQSRLLLHYINRWDDFLQERSSVFGNREEKDPSKGELMKLAERAVGDVLDDLKRIAQEIVSDEKKAFLTEHFFDRINRLTRDIPPSIRNEKSESFAEICSAAWGYQIIYGEEREKAEKTLEKKHEEYEKTCRLLLKAIELIPPPKKNTGENTVEIIGESDKENITEGDKKSESENSEKSEGFGVLSAKEIRRRINLNINHEQHLSVTPFDSDAVKSASLDVHLGNWFASAKRTKLKAIQLNSEEEKALLERIGKDELFIPSDKTFLLHPGDLALGITKEFFALPKDLMAFVEGRSSLGRLGLFVATATQVAPTFHGVIVLELVNAGTVPLELKPGTPIAQMIFQRMTEPVLTEESYRNKGGRYYCQIKP